MVIRLESFRLLGSDALPDHQQRYISGNETQYQNVNQILTENIYVWKQRISLNP